jgi:HPt (histidine-containing phosphotransfer) domain-containing protein
MTAPLIDFDFLYGLASNDKKYVHEVIKLYLDTMPAGLERLEQSIRNGSDYEVIQKQAHFLKSSASVVKVDGMYDDLIAIEGLARQCTGLDEMVTKLDHMLSVFKQAEPTIIAEKKKCAPKKGK